MKNKPYNAYQVANQLLKTVKPLLKKSQKAFNKSYIQRQNKSAYIEKYDFAKDLYTTQTDYFEKAAKKLLSRKEWASDKEDSTQVVLRHWMPFVSFAFSPYVYSIDETYQEEIKTISVDTPLEIFSKIPHYSTYLHLPMQVNGKFFCGLLATRLLNKNKQFLNVSFIENEDGELWSSYSIEFRVDTDETVDYFLDTIRERTGKCYEDARFKEYDTVALSLRALSALLWLCVEEPDISDFTGKVFDRKAVVKNHVVKNKSGELIPPPQPIMRIIGKRLGGEIRKFKACIEQSANEQGYNQRTVKPHIRSGHWHGYWYGTGDNKIYDVRWVDATLVNAKI